MRAHIDHAFQPELGANRRCGHAMLARAGFRDDPGFAHAAGQNDLTQHIVDLVRAGVVQLIPLHVDLGAAQMGGQAFAEIKRAGAANVVLPQPVHLGPEGGVGLGKFVAFLKIKDQRHQGFGHKTPAELAKTALFIGTGHKAVGIVLGHVARS